MSSQTHADVVFDPTVIIQEEDLSIHRSSRIDSFCLINASGGVELGAESVIHCGSHVVGSGGLSMGDRAVVTYNCTLITSTADLRYPASSVVDRDERRSKSGKITLEDETFVGSGAVLMPGVTLHEGACVGANAYVDQDVPPWTIRLPDGRDVPREFVGDTS